MSYFITTERPSRATVSALLKIKATVDLSEPLHPRAQKPFTKMVASVRVKLAHIRGPTSPRRIKKFITRIVARIRARFPNSRLPSTKKLVARVVATIKTTVRPSRPGRPQRPVTRTTTVVAKAFIKMPYVEEPTQPRLTPRQKKMVAKAFVSVTKILNKRFPNKPPTRQPYQGCYRLLLPRDTGGEPICQGVPLLPLSAQRSPLVRATSPQGLAKPS